MAGASCVPRQRNASRREQVSRRCAFTCGERYSPGNVASEQDSPRNRPIAQSGTGETTMRSIITSVLLGLGALGVTAATPASSQASWLSEAMHRRYDPGYYGAYSYAPAYPYNAPVYDYSYSAPNYDGYAAPYYDTYAAPYYAPYR